MRITVIGATGLIGSRVVDQLRSRGHDVVPAARALGVNSFTGEGLEESLVGAEVVVDASNSSYVDEAAAREFFYASTLNLLHYGAAAGVRHHVVLSVVGTDRLAEAEGGYFQAKLQQERLVETSGRPYSLVHATQFFEFIRSIVDNGTRDRVATLADVRIQPMAADDVAAAVADIALGDPVGRIVETAGPEVFDLGDLARHELHFGADAREVVADPLGTYFGARLHRDDLLPGPGVRIAETRLADWRASAASPVARF